MSGTQLLSVLNFTWEGKDCVCLCVVYIIIYFFPFSRVPIETHRTAILERLQQRRL